MLKDCMYFVVEDGESDVPAINADLLLKSLREFISDWKTTAELDGVKIEDIQVNLVSVITDFVEMMNGGDEEIVELGLPRV